MRVGGGSRAKGRALARLHRRTTANSARNAVLAKGPTGGGLSFWNRQPQLPPIVVFDVLSILRNLGIAGLPGVVIGANRRRATSHSVLLQRREPRPGRTRRVERGLPTLSMFSRSNRHGGGGALCRKAKTVGQQG